MMDFRIRRASLNDVDGIMEIMEEARCNTEHPDWFAADDAEFVKGHLADKGFVIVAETQDGRIAGFFLVKEPELKENLGTYLGFGEDKLARVAVMDSAAVGSQFRGNGLQGKMLEAAEAFLDKERFSYLMCTIHPDNRYSLRNMRSHGYEVKMKTKCYGGLERYILLKECK